MSDLAPVRLGDEAGPEALAVNRACPITADFTFTFNRAPDFFRWPRSVFDGFDYWGVRLDGKLVGYMMHATRAGWTGEDWGRFGYGGDARVLPGYRLRGVARSLIDAIREHMPDDVEVGFSIVKVGNRPVEDAIAKGQAEPPRDPAWDGGMLGLYRAYNVFFVPSGRDHAAQVRRATPDDVDAILALLGAQHTGRLFAPRPDRARLLAALRGDEAEVARPVYWVAEDDAGRLVGTLGLWDLDPMHRPRVLKRSWRARLTALGYAAWRLLHPDLTPLPRAGETFRGLSAIDIAMEQRRPDVLVALLDHLIGEHAGQGLHFLQVGFMADDPLCAALDGFRAARFESNLGVWYRTSWLDRVGQDALSDPYIDLTLL